MRVSHVSLLFLKALSTLRPPETHLHISLPQMKCVGPGEPTGPENSLYMSLHALQRKPSLLASLYLSCALYFIFCEVLSQVWYHFILPLACEVDYRNLVTDEGSKTQRGCTACPRTHNRMAVPGLTPISYDARADFLFTTSKQPPHQNVLVNSPRVQQGDSTEARDLLLHVRQRTVEITASATRSDFELWVSY